MPIVLHSFGVAAGLVPPPGLEVPVVDYDVVASLRAEFSGRPSETLVELLVHGATPEVRSAARGLLAERVAPAAAPVPADPRSALAAANDGEERLRAVRPWEAQMSTLSVWTDTVDGILSALADLARATTAHDAAAAASARSAYEAAAAGASRADRARAIAISEGAGKVSAPALEGLADAMERVQRARAGVSSLAPS